MTWQPAGGGGRTQLRSMAFVSSAIASGGSVIGRLLLDGPAPDGFAGRPTSNSATVPHATIAVQVRATVVGEPERADADA